jgi:hypothetical protein
MKGSSVLKAASLLSPLCMSHCSLILIGKLTYLVAPLALAQDKFTHEGTGIEFWYAFDTTLQNIL